MVKHRNKEINMGKAHNNTHSMFYQCPMKCEGEKVYDKPGDCPVCNMHLLIVEEIGMHDKLNITGSQGEHDYGQHKEHGHVIHHESKSPLLVNGKYYCPMQCEADRTYDKPGDCPKCGMQLVKEDTISPSAKVYTCPMHPDVKQKETGSCPKCGMDLVPENGDDVSEEEKAYKRMAKKFWIAFSLSIPVFVIAMSEFLSFLHLDNIASKETWRWVQFILASPVVFYSSRDFFKRGWSSIRRWSPNMWTLISLGVGSAYLFSVFGLLFPGIFPVQFKDTQGNVHLYFEAAAVILTLVLLGQVLELRAHSKTSSAIKALLGLVPPVARILRNGQEEEIPLELVQAGDILRVKPGEKIPVDGLLTNGKAIIDESMITGEPMPVEKEEQDSITAGTLNGKTAFEMVAEKVGSDTLLSQIIEMVNEASRSRAPIQKLADIVAKYFVQIVIAVALITFAIW